MWWSITIILSVSGSGPQCSGFGLSVVFPVEERGKAVGIWAAMAGAGAPIGLLVGGWSVENYGWEMVFWLNVPVIIVTLILGLFLVPNSKDEQQRPIDLVGSLLVIIVSKIKLKK